MKYCTMCGAALEDEAVFCSVCGTKQPAQQNVQQEQIPQQPVPQNIQQEQMPQQQVAQNYQPYQQQAYFQQNQMLQQPSAQNYQPYPQQPVQNYQPYPQQPYFQPNQMSQQQVAQQNMQQGQMPQQPFIAQAQSMQAPTLQEQTNQSQPTQNPAEQTANSGKKKKKLLIASITAVLIIGLIIGLGMGAYFLFFKKKTESKVEVLDKYFEALNDMDFEKIDELYTSNTEKRYHFTENKPISTVLTRDFEYYRGAIIEVGDLVRMSRDIMDMYCRSYGFSGYVDSMEERKKVSENNDLFKEKHKDFKASYELISYEEASKYNISYRQGANSVEIDNMSAYISDKLNVDVDNVYVAKIHIKWSYGNKKYGYDESWWQNDTFKDYLEVQGGIMDETTMRRVSDYDDIIDAYDHIIYDVFIYESDGKQYIYNPNIIRNHYMGIKAD